MNAKLIHIERDPKQRWCSFSGVHVLCGRSVNFVSTGTEAQATCKQCLAMSLSRPVSMVKGMGGTNG